METKNIRPFGALPDGRQVEEIVLRSAGASCSILTYGGALRTLTVPDRRGQGVDIVLGYDRLEDYLV